MTLAIHPVATPHLPAFITPPGQNDVLMIVAIVTLLGAVLGVGLIFLRLHTLPERMAHKAHKLQFEIVAVLGLLALFTHIHLFWVAGLLLALIEIPDFWNPLRRMAGSLEKIAGLPPGSGADRPEESPLAPPTDPAPPPAEARHDADKHDQDGAPAHA